MMMEENHLFHYTLFRSFWDSRRRDPRRCLKHLQRCIELCPGFGVAQVYMALWKWRVEQDHEAAVDCYVRAYTLRPSDASVVRAYTDFCTVEQQDAKAMEILQTALESKKFTTEDSRWMRLRLALLAYRNMLWQDCINNLRSVLRDFPVDRLIQEFLGDALCFRGNYWSAMGIFEGVIEAAARDGQFADYSWSRRAFIKQLLKLDDEAEKEFEELHRRAAWHRQTCLQSLAQLQIKKAKAAFAAYFPICGIQCCQKAIDLLTEAIFSSGNCSAFIWSLLGDACILMRFIGPGSGDLLVDHFLWDGTQRGDKIKLNIRQILYLATIFYSTAIDMKRTSARLWERLAVSYWFLAQRVSSHDDDKEGARKWMNRALLAVKEMLLRNPNNPWLWTTAGFVVGSPSAVGLNSPADAARMLTKAVEIFSRLELNPTSVAQTWVSLGYLYLNEKRYMAAHEILKQAQSADPGLAEAWQGQAWCAEKTGYSVEAIDLCRHACTLGLLPESMRRYAEWIIWVLHDKTLDSHLKHEILVRLEAVPTALNYLGQYVQMYPQDVRISMLMSSLQEWAGLRKSALLSAQRALDLIGNSGERFEPTNNRTWNMAKINVARLLCATGEYRSALDMMGSVDMEPTLNILIFMAVLNFRLGNFDECVAMLDMTLEDEYETTGKEANNNNDGEESYRCTKLPLSHAVILAKAAVVVYSVVDDNDGEYVKNLVQLYEEKTDINIRLKCLCLMAILDREIFREMASIFLQEIYEFRWNNMDHHLSSIVLVTKLMEADQETAERNACRFVHIRPERHDLRLIMARAISADPTEENLLYADAIHTAVEMNEHVGRMKRFEPSLNIWQEVVDHWLLAKIRSDENTHDENGVGGISSRCLQKAVRLFPMQSWQDYL